MENTRSGPADYRCQKLADIPDARSLSLMEANIWAAQLRRMTEDRLIRAGGVSIPGELRTSSAKPELTDLFNDFRRQKLRPARSPLQRFRDSAIRTSGALPDRHAPRLLWR